MAQDMNLNVKHIVAESTNILSTNFGGGHIYSITIGEDMDNGLIVCRNEYLGDETWSAKKYVAGEEPLFLLAPPIVPFTQLKGYADEDRFYNKNGDRVRAYTLRAGDRISLSENAFDTAPAVGQYVTYDADAKQYVVGDAADASQFCAQVLTKILRSNLVMYKLQIVSL
jgi:hypothetical protein